MEKTWQKVFGVAFAVLLVLFSVSGCESESDSGGDIPDEVVDVAEGLFDVLDMMLDDSSYFPSGLSKGTWTSSYRVLNAYNYQPDPGVYVTGTAVLELVSTSPYKINIDVDYVITGGIYATVSMSGAAQWAAGKFPGEDVPSSISGDFMYNEESYKNDDILDAVY